MRGAGRRPLTVLVYNAADAHRYAELIRPRGDLTVRIATDADAAGAAVDDADVLYAWKFPARLYARAGRLSWLQVMGAGVDSALVPELPPHVVVTRAPGVFGPWMAEYVIGWCAWVTQRMATYLAAQRQRRWIAEALPDRLRGKTMVIVGMGDIGRTIARAARALGMRVLGVSRSGRAVREAERVYPARALRRALGEADFAVLVVPLTDRTRGLVGAAELAALPPRAWLLNVARGAVLDEQALVEALAAKRVAGAVLDVFAEEPLPPDHPLWALDNVVITPHVSGPNVPEEIAPVFAENLARFLAGRRLRHIVDRSRGY